MKTAAAVRALRRNRLPARLPRRLQPRRHGPGRQGHRPRRIDRQPDHRRLHLRQGPPLSRADVRPRSRALPGGAQGAERQRLVRARVVGRRAGSHRRPVARGARRVRRRGDPALLVRRTRTACSRRTRATRRSSAGSAPRASRAPCARPPPAPPTRRSTARCRRSSIEDFPEARLIILWGVNPSASGIHLVPYLREAQKRGARLVVIDPRTTPLARQADLHLPVRPGTDLPVALSIHRYLFEEGRADQAFLDAHTRNADRLRERAAKWTFACAAAEAGVPAADIERLAQWYADASPGARSAAAGARNAIATAAASSMAILALPAVAGKFGVRGGGYAMSNSSAWGIERTWIRDQEPADAARQHEPAGARAHRVRRSAGQGAVRLQLERGGHLAAPDQGPAGPRARGSVHGGLRADAHRHGALRRRPAAGDDVPRGLRPGARLRLDQPAPRPAGRGAGRRIAAERRRVRRAA